MANSLVAFVGLMGIYLTTRVASISVAWGRPLSPSVVPDFPGTGVPNRLDAAGSTGVHARRPMYLYVRLLTS